MLSQLEREVTKIDTEMKAVEKSDNLREIKSGNNSHRIIKLAKYYQNPREWLLYSLLAFTTLFAGTFA